MGGTRGILWSALEVRSQEELGQESCEILETILLPAKAQSLVFLPSGATELQDNGLQPPDVHP